MICLLQPLQATMASCREITLFIGTYEVNLEFNTHPFFY